MKMKSTYEKPSEKKRVQTENLKRIKNSKNLKTGIKFIYNERINYAIW